MDSFTDQLVSAQFVIGFLAGLAAYWVKCRIYDYLLYRRTHERRRTRLNPVWIAGGLTALLLAYIMASTQATANRTQQIIADARTFSVQVQDCQRQFNDALQNRAAITSENDELSQQQRRIIFDWIHDLIFPPKPYSDMPANDPQRRDYQLTRTIETERKLQDSLNRQDVLQKQRDAHPLPNPTCGR